MTEEEQIQLRDTILAHVFPMVAAPTPRAIASATAACVGAAAVVVALLPDEARRSAVLQLVQFLPLAAEKRAREIRSGKFDRDLHRRRN
ncbi:MAG: hypothetical protein U1E23_14835 [Reyranellaceae bacterium]